MQTPMDQFARDRQEMAEQAAAGERARRRNVQVFAEMFLSLGADCLKLGGASHDLELAEAKALAAARWSRLVELEGQVQREEQALVARPKKRPAAPGDNMLASEVIERLNRAFEEESKGRRDGFEVLKAQAKRERVELESYITKSKRR